MHLLHIVTSMDPAAGGVAEGVRLLMRGLQGMATGEVLTLDDPSAPFLNDLPFPVHALGPSSGGYVYSPRLAPWLRANRHRFGGVIVNGMWQSIGLASMWAFRYGPPYMVYTHGMLDPYFKRRFPLKHLKKVLYWYPLEYWVLRRAARVLFTTEIEETLARQSFALWRWRPAVVPYGILPSPSTQAEDLEAFNDALPALRGKRFLLFLGRIHPKKGCDMLIRAFCDAAASRPDLHLLMAGPDETGWMAELQRLTAEAGIADRVHWPGTLRGRVKWGAFRAADAFILPSHQENFGIAVAEALACGLPVLLSDQVNIISLLAGYDCSIVEPDTPEGTRRLVDRWESLTSQQREAMRQGALRCYEQRLNLAETARTVHALFQQAITKGEAAKL